MSGGKVQGDSERAKDLEDIVDLKVTLLDTTLEVYREPHSGGSNSTAILGSVEIAKPQAFPEVSIEIPNLASNLDSSPHGVIGWSHHFCRLRVG